VAALD